MSVVDKGPSDFKLQISEKNKAGGMLNVRANSVAELETLLAELSGSSVATLYPAIIVNGNTAAPQQGQEQTQTPASQPQAAAQPRQVVWAEGTKPRGGGTFQYRPSDNLPTESFKQAIAQKIQAAGYDPELFVIYDERLGPKGLEVGGSSYGPASVKPTKQHPAYDSFLKGRAVQAAFFVDFEKNGGVKVNPTNALKEASAAPAAPAADNDVPF